MKKLIVLLFITVINFTSIAYAESEKVYVDVNGLVCDFCAQAIDKTFKKQPAVQDIEVDLGAKLITIAYKDGQRLEEEKITSLITDAGYTVVDIRHTN